ncbi:MAG: carboxypeptidase-like regulatory domain-containing protein, partial [Mediterranea sp.]|nr:carboxypeptidase-like regulatory domain-containing protein [Mediterranea sp.]
MTRRLLCCVLAAGYLTLLAAQTKTISGKVLKASTAEVVEGATVVLRSAADEQSILVAYVITEADGRFNLSVTDSLADNSFLQISCIGYKQVVLHAPFAEHLVVKLTEEAFMLKEVVVKADKIVQRGDTVSYNIAGFAQSQD